MNFKEIFFYNWPKKFEVTPHILWDGFYASSRHGQ